MRLLLDDCFIPDGYTLTRSVPAIPGLHPDLVIMYRPALAKERIAALKTTLRSEQLIETIKKPRVIITGAREKK